MFEHVPLDQVMSEMQTEDKGIEWTRLTTSAR